MNILPRWLPVLVLVAGCGRAGPVPAVPGPGPSAPADGPRSYTLKGVVRRVDVESGEVTIAHEELPGFMKAMTMPFLLKDRAALDDVRPGDEVEGPLRVTFAGGKVEDYELADLTVTRPALAQPPPALGPDLSGGLAPAGPRPATLRVGDPVPDFALTTQDGATLRLADLKGEVVALTFIYTRCPLPDFCPAIDRKFADLARRLSAVSGRADHVRLLSISFDPDHDTPEVLRAHARLRGAKPPLWSFAVASDEELRKVAGGLGLEYTPISGQVAHTRSAAVVGPDGRLARLENGRDWTPDDLYRTITGLAHPLPR